MALIPIHAIFKSEQTISTAVQPLLKQEQCSLFTFAYSAVCDVGCMQRIRFMEVSIKDRINDVR